MTQTCITALWTNASNMPASDRLFFSLAGELSKYCLSSLDMGALYPRPSPPHSHSVEWKSSALLICSSTCITLQLSTLQTSSLHITGPPNASAPDHFQSRRPCRLQPKLFLSQRAPVPFGVHHDTLLPRHASLPLLPTPMFLANLFLIQEGLAEAIPRQVILTVHARADLSAAYYSSSSSQSLMLMRPP